MEASARASLNFLEQLYLFHRQHGSAGMVIPSIMGKAVDLWKLKREVGALGGYFTVSRPAFLSAHSFSTWTEQTTSIHRSRTRGNGRASEKRWDTT